MQGLLLLLFAKLEHVPFIRDIQTTYTRTGVFRYWVRNTRMYKKECATDSSKSFRFNLLSPEIEFGLGTVLLCEFGGDLDTAFI